MKEFASAAMIRILRHGMARQGLAPPCAPAATSAHVPLSDKRAILTRILDAEGPLGLLRVTDGITSLPMEPLLRVLVLAKDVEDLLDRWQRLERFAHSRHRITCSRTAEGVLVLDHTAPGHDERPSWVEDLVVYGVIVNLCEIIGARGLLAGPITPTGALALWRRDGEWIDACASQEGRPWGIESTPPLDSDGYGSTDPRIDGVAARIRAMVRADPARRWRVGAVAAHLAMSTRNLQRRLALENTNLTQAILAERLEQATRLMQDGGAGIAQIGFVCGFADQAHFSRLFKRATGMTPAVYEKILRSAK